MGHPRRLLLPRSYRVSLNGKMLFLFFSFFRVFRVFRGLFLLFPRQRLHPVDHPDARQGHRAAQQRGPRQALAQHRPGHRHRHQRLDIEENAHLRSRDGFQRVVPEDIRQPRAEHAQEDHRDPAVPGHLAHGLKLRVEQEQQRGEAPAKRHHIEHHARRRVLLQPAPRKDREHRPVGRADHHQ